MSDEISKELEAIFMERLKTEKYLRKLISTPNEVPNPFFDIERARARADYCEFRQEYLGEFVSTEK
ncbi:MAG: hypothetical protein WC919_00715 [Candidatus Paceibacterota bacterium]|jgi:hypothetical protein